MLLCRLADRGLCRQDYRARSPGWPAQPEALSFLLWHACSCERAKGALAMVDGQPSPIFSTARLHMDRP